MYIYINYPIINPYFSPSNTPCAAFDPSKKSALLRASHKTIASMPAAKDTHSAWPWPKRNTWDFYRFLPSDGDLMGICMNIL